MHHQLYLGRVFNPLGEERVEYCADGGILVDQATGKVVTWGRGDDLIISGTEAAEKNGGSFQVNHAYKEMYLIPGLVDTHIHYPQANLLARPGYDLMEWLEKSIFPGEIRMRDPEYARTVATTLLGSMLEAGTTSALIYGVTYLEAMNVLCEEALVKGVRAYPGKMLMDQGAPPELLDASAGQGYEDAQKFIANWQGQGNVQPSIALRFALTSSEEQMRLTAKLLDEHPGLLFQTHLNENEREIAAVAAQFPRSTNYLNVYEYYGLHRSQSVYGHCVHMKDDEVRSMEAADAAVAYCPCSNLYLASGLFNWEQLAKLRVGFGSDVGAGYTYSVLENAKLALVLQKLRGYQVSPAKIFYHATLGGAKVLRNEANVGNFTTGKEADFIALDTSGDFALEAALDGATTSEEILLLLIMLHQRSHVKATLIAGEQRYAAVG